MLTITFAVWWLPVIISVVSIGWALFWVDGGGGMFSGLANIVALVPALVLTALAWFIYGVTR